MGHVGEVVITEYFDEAGQVARGSELLQFFGLSSFLHYLQLGTILLKVYFAEFLRDFTGIGQHFGVISRQVLYLAENVLTCLLRLPCFNNRYLFNVLKQILRAEVEADSFESDLFGNKAAYRFAFEESFTFWRERHQRISAVQDKSLGSHEDLVEVDNQVTLRDVRNL